MTAGATAGGELALYGAMLIAAVIPNGVWRWIAVFAAARLDDDSPFFLWVRHVATCLVAGVVAQLLIAPPGALALAPGWMRVGALVAAALIWRAAGGRVYVAWLAGISLLAAGVALR